MAQRALISLTMIVKNEESNLPRVLASARGLADELVVVDTGSTDRTVEIARAHGAKDFSFEWIDDFSAARNYALERATGDWVLILDGDDVALESAPGALRAEVAAQPDHVFFMRVPVRSPGGDGTGSSVIGSRRLFRNVPEIRWHNRIHENLFHATREHEPDIEVAARSLMIDHHGYAVDDPAVHAKRARRNSRMLRQAIADSPENPYLPYYLAVGQFNARHFAAALETVRGTLRRFQGRVRPDFEGAVRCLGMRAAMALGRPTLAVQLGLPAIRVYAYSELCYWLGLAYVETGELAQADRFLRLALSLRDRVAEFQSEAGTGSWKALIQLGSVAWLSGERENACARWRQAHQWAPDQALTNLALGRGLLMAGEPAEALPHLRRAVELAPRMEEAKAALAEGLKAVA